MFDLTYDPSVVAGILVYPIAAWFLFIFIFSDSGYKYHSIIIALSSIINLLTNGLTKDFTYIQDASISIIFDGVTGVIMVMFLGKDKLIPKQSLLLAFAAVCHFMIVYDLTVYSSVISNLFYIWYDELIIVVGLLQIGVAYNGFTTAYNNAPTKLQVSIFWLGFGYNYMCKSLSTRKKREIKA